MNPPKLKRKRTSPVQKALAPNPAEIAKNYAQDKKRDQRTNLADPNVITVLKQLIPQLMAEGPVEESSAARKCGVPVHVLEEWKRTDDVFAGELVAAFRAGTDTLASAGLARAMKKSDRLVEFFLGQRDPDRFNKDPKKTNAGGMLTMTLEQIETFIQHKRREEAMLAKTIEGHAEVRAVDTLPLSES